MKFRGPVAALVVGLSLATLPRQSLAETTMRPNNEGADLLDAPIDELIVQRLPGRSSLGAVNLIENEVDVDAAVESQIGNRYEVIALDQPVSREQADNLTAELVASGKVVSASINERRFVATAPNDPYYDLQWYLKDFTTTLNLGIGIENAWTHSVGSPSIVIAVIDTGGTQHPDMSGRILPGYDFYSNDADSTDDGDGSNGTECPAYPNTWHGTKVAGVIAANVNNGIGISGVNQYSYIQHIRILGPCGGGVDDEIKAFRWAAGLDVQGAPRNLTPARVINFSVGGVGTCSVAEQDAINEVVANGVVVVVAAGNGGSDQFGDDLDAVPNAPANCENVITVAATTFDGGRSRYSNFGSPVDVAAPGTCIDTTTVGGSGYAVVTGTSFATPIVSGIVSLMLSGNPILRYEQIRAMLSQPDVVNPFPIIRRSIDGACGDETSFTCSSNIDDVNYCGLGIVDAGHAVDAALFLAPEVYSPLQPQRIADTRPATLVEPGNVLILDIKGTFGLPTQGLGAVVLNVTATGATDNGYVTVWPCSAPKPYTSVLNYRAGEDIPNTVIAPPDQYGKICLDSSTPVHLIADLDGWFISGDGFYSFTPQRAFDTRPYGPVIPENPYPFQMTGYFGLPTSGVTSVVLNVTATGATEPGYVTVWPCDQPQPYTSNLNYLPYQDIANAVIATVDSSGRVCFASSTPVHLVADVSGWLAAGSSLSVVTPRRIFDTRPGDRISTSPVYVLDVAASAGLARGETTALVLNVTAAGASQPGYATVWPCDQAQPPTSNLNFKANQDIPNMVITKVSSANTVCFNSSTPVHLIADLMGWFVP